MKQNPSIPPHGLKVSSQRKLDCDLECTVVGGGVPPISGCPTSMILCAPDYLCNDVCRANSLGRWDFVY